MKLARISRKLRQTFRTGLAQFISCFYRYFCHTEIDFSPHFVDKNFSIFETLRAMRAASKAVAKLDKRENIKPTIETGDWLYEEVFILGSGASLCTLSKQELAFLSKQKTIAMNKYLLFWDLIGIWPTYVYLADIFRPTEKVMAELVQVACSSELPVPTFILDSGYSGWPLGCLPCEFFRRPHTWTLPDGEPHPWADTIDQPMYFHRGSLTCLLNWIAVKKIAKKVSLLGVDLVGTKAFYADAISRRQDLHNEWFKLEASGNKHGTAVEHKGLPPIQARLPYVFKEMKARGITVSVVGDQSFLAREGLCPVREELV